MNARQRNDGATMAETVEMAGPMETADAVKADDAAMQCVRWVVR